MECSCYQRNVHDKVSDGKEASEKTIGPQFDRLLIPVEANVSCKPITSTDETRLHQLRKKMLPGVFMEDVSRVGGGLSVDLPVADWKDLENLSASDIHVERFKHQEVALEGNGSFRAPGESLGSSIFLGLHAAKCPPAETLSKMKAKKSTSWSKKKMVNTFF